MSFSRPVRVLYMEDDEGLARLFQRKLERLGFQVDLARDGREGLAACSSVQYDAVVVDHNMPGQSGLEVIRALSEKGSMPPTIMVTGTGDESVAVQALKLGANDYIIKDTDGGYLDLMGSVIDQALSKQRLIEEKQRAEEELQRARDELEIRVRERTAELAAVVDKLRIEMRERARAEQELRASERRYRSLVDNIDLGVTLIDEDFRILTINAVQAGMFGRPQNAFIGEKCFEAFAARKVRCRLCPGPTALTTGQQRDLDIRTITHDGRTIELRVRAFPVLSKDASAKGFIEVVEDVTERKRLEEQLHHAVKMEAIGRLAGGVAHDFNNILTAIIGYASLLLRSGDTDGPSHHKLVQINRAAERASGLTRQLLAFSRKQVLQQKVCDLNAIIADFEKILHRLIGEDISLVTSRGPSLGYVRADPGQIEQILMNLVVNARDAMPKGGTLKIQTANVILDETHSRSNDKPEPGKYVTLAVSDSGHGMSEEIRPHIFEPFFTTKGEGKGTGLGLPTVYGIVKMHHGYIDVESAPNRGTTFRIYLAQVDEAVTPDPEPEDIRIPAGHGEGVLVVEDEDMVRDLSCKILEMLGYAVQQARNPEEALKICGTSSEPIHLLLTDVVLPQMDGRSLFNQLSARFPEMRVLYMSGYTGDSAFGDGALEPGVRLLQKPFSPDRLGKIVREVLDGTS